jgi:predicted transposase/invertase (TIGR01784 family)
MKNLFEQRRFSKELRRLAGEKAAQGEPLSVMDDVVFKAMLTSDTEDSREALRSLLSACTRRPVSAVQVRPNDLIPPHLDAKMARFDVHVTFNDGEAADLEMQMSKTNDDLKVRAEVYNAMLLSAQSRKGRDYKEIKRVYQIFFLNCVLFPQSTKLPQRFNYREEKEFYRLNDISEIIFYELPKLEERVRGILIETEKIKDLSEEEKWCIFMKYRHDEQTVKLVEKLYFEGKGIMRAEKAISKIDRDYWKYARQMVIEKNRLDRGQRIYDMKQEARAEGLAEGKAQGLAEGRVEGKFEIAQKMKTAGRPLAEIAEFTGLSFEEIEKAEN